MESYLRVGVITAPHGLKGEVKVYPTTDSAERFRELKKVMLDTHREQRMLEVEGVKFFKDQVIVKFKGLDRIEDVEELRRCDLLVSREDAVACGENENYIGDLIGLDVVTDEGILLGRLQDVYETGANDVYIVQTPSGKEVMIPAIRDCILNVDLENHKMLVHLLDGLLDL